MLKQPACAAASSSSGFDPFLPSKRVPKLNEPLNTPLCALKLPLPSLSLPSQTATALLVAMIDCSDGYRGTGNLARHPAVRYASRPFRSATDLQRSMAFYRDVLGFVVGEEWRENDTLEGCEMLAGAVRFYLTQDDFAKGRDRKKGIGSRLSCTTAQDLDRFAAEVKARGGALDQEPMDMPWGERLFMITDPDGFKLTFVQAR